MGLGDTTPQREFGTRVNQSVYGAPVIVAMGTAQVEQQVLWVDGFSATAAPTKGSGGGGKGGGKSGQYLYSADVVVGLCAGPIQGVGDVWAGQSWIGTIDSAEQYTIAGPSYTYTPTNASTLVVSTGVGVTNTYSASYNDFGAPSPTVLSGTFLAGMTQVPYGNALTTGEYSINPTGNVYNFSSADVGRTVTISYSYNVTDINRQENDIVPAGQTITVTAGAGNSNVIADGGVVYTTTGVALTRVSGSPTTGQYYYVDTGGHPNTYVYHFASGDVNALVTVTYTVSDTTVLSAGETSFLNYTLNNGAQSQSPYSFLTSDYPDAAFGYTGIATLLYQPMDLGMGSEIQENRFEVVTYDIYGGGIEDCNPVQCLYQVLTNPMWGLGVGTIPFPTACIDNSGSGTWGGAPAAGTSTANGTAWNWFAAQNFFISPVIDGQDTAASVASKWLEAGMCAAYFSEGLLKLVPYGDTSAAANGVTWTAPSNFVVALDDTCFLEGKEGEDPVKISRVSAHDAWNVVQVQWDNRLNQYAPEITQESDQGLINRWGERREDPQNWDFIHTVASATFAANMRIKHNGYIRNTYEFMLPYSYSYLEPMDVATLSTTSIWAAGLNNVNLGVTNLPVRITKIVDDPVKGLQITAEDYPFGAHQPTLYNKQLNESEPVANLYADPGNSEVVMFEATSRLTLFDGDQIWIGALGTSSTWGSTNIWVSQTSGGDYQCVGTIKTPARLGTLASMFGDNLGGSPPTHDPDTADTLVINLAENCASLQAGSDADADAGNTMCFVDGEIISYSALTYTGQNQVTMGVEGSPPSGYMRRGQMGSTISSHSGGSLFMRLDSSIFKYTYDPAWRGQTLYFKFQSVNAFGLMAQDLSSLTPVAFTLPGDNVGSVDAESGLVISETALPFGLVGGKPVSGGGTPVPGSVPDGSTNFSATASTLTYRPITNPLTATVAGSFGSPPTGIATINIAAFTMRTSSKGDISVSGGSIVSLNASQLYYVYYSDPTLAGGAVTYNVTTTKETAISGTGLFFIGSIVTPAPGAPSTTGNNDGGIGAQSGQTSVFLFGTAVGVGSTPVDVNNPNNAIDGKLTTYCQFSMPSLPGTNTSAPATLTLAAASPTANPWSSLTLNVLSSASLAGGSTHAVAEIQYSLDGGNSWTTIYSITDTNRSLTIDSVALPYNQNLALCQVQVSFSFDDTTEGGAATQNTYLAWVVGLT